MVLSISDHPRMEQDRGHMAARILDLTLEIIYWITGEDHIVVKLSSRGRSRTPSDLTKPPPHSLIHEKKILELTHRITDLLSGEVPIRCQDVTIHFSMEEWEYLEGHKDLYKDVENHPSITSLDGSSQRYRLERSPSPLHSQDLPEKEENVPRDHQVDAESSVVKSGLETPTSASVTGEVEMRASNGHHHFSPYSEVENNSSRQDNSVIPKVTIEGHSGERSTDTAIHKSRFFHNSPFSCSECGKSFTRKSNLIKHEISHTGEKPFFCTECGKCFSRKPHLKEHLRTHTGEKPYSCSECGRCFCLKRHFVGHLRTHTGEKPYSCPECGNCFSRRAGFLYHLTTHTGEKPFSCSQCEKYFLYKSALDKHVISHSGKKLYSCTECGKCYSHSSGLLYHLSTHTGEKPFSCSQCEKYFVQKSDLVKHEMTHSGKKPFSCSECGKGFRHKQSFTKHQKSHN